MDVQNVLVEGTGEIAIELFIVTNSLGHETTDKLKIFQF
jgi:hypothetical protein